MSLRALITQLTASTVHKPPRLFTSLAASAYKTMQSVSLRPSGGSRAPFVQTSASVPLAAAPKAQAPVVSPVVARPSGGTRTLIAQSPKSVSDKRLLIRSQASKADASDAKSTPSSSVNDSQKTVVITGGNTGIGFEAAKALGQQGYNVTITTRSDEKGKSAVDRLQAEIPSGTFSYQLLSLDDLSSVRDFSKRMCDNGAPIDVLLNNAGVMACPEMKTKDGFEYQLGVNHLGHFVLTSGLLPLMTDSGRSSRIINVASSAQLFGDISFDDPNWQTRKYQNWAAYGQSKLANVFFTFELAQRLPVPAQVTANCLHPGVVATELARYLQPEDSPAFVKALAEFVNRNFLKTPVQGAQTSIYLASSPEVEGVSCKYFIDSKPSTASYKAYDADARARFWDLSCELTDTQFDVAALAKASAGKEVLLA
eukprot:jgi/Ulvmu1/2567/UM014_0018.1